MDLLSDKNLGSILNKKILLSFSHILNVNIEILWKLLRDLMNLNDRLSKNFIFIKGNNTWKIGNKFSFFWYNLYNVKGETIDIIDESERKKISWKIETDFGFHYIKSCYLYKISEKEQTLLKLIITTKQVYTYNLLSTPQKNYFHSINIDFEQKKRKFFQKTVENTISYESCIVNANFKTIWDLITDLKKIGKLAPIIGTNIESWGMPLEVGSFWKSYLNNYHKTVFLKVNKVEMNEKKNIWLYSCETIGTDEFIIPQEIQFRVIKLEEKKTQLSLTNKFSKKINKNVLKILNINKRDILKRIKRYLESNIETNEKKIEEKNEDKIDKIFIDYKKENKNSN